jgi:O-antigen ligase
MLTISMAGFLAVSYIPGFLHLQSRAATVPFRALVLGMLIITLFRIYRYASIRMTPTTILAAFFIAAYSLRVIYDEMFRGIRLDAEPWEIVLYLFGMCIPAFVVFYLIRNIYSYRKALVWTLITVATCCFLSALTTNAKEIKMQGNRYAGNAVLNHVEFGHMGVTAIILGLFVFLGIGRKYSPVLRLIGLGSIGLGAFALLSAASRGALVSGVLLVILIIFYAFFRGSKMLTISICLGAVLMFGFAVESLREKGVNLDPLLMMSEGYTANNQSTFTRELLYRDAWQQYLNNPIVGNSFVEENSLLYPHNIIIESYMATGTFGGAAFTLLILISLWRSILLLIRAPEMAWVPICYLQYLLGAMFSGGIYANVLLWGMLGIILGVDIPKASNVVLYRVHRRRHAVGRLANQMGREAGPAAT